MLLPPRPTKLLADLLSIHMGGDFPLGAVATDTLNSNKLPTANELVVHQSTADRDGELPILSAMRLCSLRALPDTASFILPPIRQIRCDFFGVITASTPDVAIKAGSERKASRALAISLATLEAVSTGKSRSSGDERKSISAATALLAKLRASIRVDTSPFKSCIHVIPATESANPLESLPYATIIALGEVFDLLTISPADTPLDYESPYLQEEVCISH